jgi:hypothetical protein
MTYSLHALLGLPGQSVNKTIDQIEGARKGEVVDGESSLPAVGVPARHPQRRGLWS